ncbi:MAG: helix-turn-helix domain-containing protein [Gaiella sp.]
MLVAPAVYEHVLLGEPRPQVVADAPTTAVVGDDIWRLCGWRMWIPPFETTRTPEVQRLVWDVRRRTGWSARRVAEILGTSHTTISRLERGGRLMTGHSGDLRRRLTDAHEVVSRVSELAGGDVDMTTNTLEIVTPSGRSAVELLQLDDAPRAYLAALDALSPRTEGLIVGTHARSGDATAALHE